MHGGFVEKLRDSLELLVFWGFYLLVDELLDLLALDLLDFVVKAEELQLL